MDDTCLPYLKPAFLFLLVATAWPALCLSSEFRPLQLPAQDQRAYQQQRNVPGPPKIEESVYVNFRRETRTLSPRQKGELEANFVRMRESALAKENIAEARHYGRLLQILRESGGRKR